jgi:hypothetical protein
MGMLDAELNPLTGLPSCRLLRAQRTQSGRRAKQEATLGSLFNRLIREREPCRRRRKSAPSVV